MVLDSGMLAFVRFLFAFSIGSHILMVSTSIALIVRVNEVTTVGVMRDAYLSITAVGAVILAAMLGFYVRVAMKGPSGPDAPE